MYPLDKMLVCLNFKSLDKTVLEYASMLAGVVQAKEVHFLHVSPLPPVPAEILIGYPELQEKPVEGFLDELRGEVEKSFTAKAATSFHVATGSHLYEILSYIQRHDMDLVVVGRGAETHTTGKLAEKVASKAHCSVLVVPDGVPAHINKLVVPVDFSKGAEDALEVALKTAQKAGVGEVILLYAFEVPVGYHRTGKSHGEFAEVLRQHARESGETFMASLQVPGVKVRLEIVESDHVGTAINTLAEREKADLVVMGARGRTALASLLLGSVTERVIWDAHHPVFAVKKKAENLDLLHALMKHMSTEG